MPRVSDQLSKLTGTTLMCLCMGFFMPSLGTYRESESFSNMAALSIFMITIVVNICIQMHTGVIILFRTEHIIILCCIMILLMALWYIALEIHNHNEVSHDAIKENFVKGQKSLLHRLKLNYLCSYNSNPQFTLCRWPLNSLVSVVCFLSFCVQSKVAFQTLGSKLLYSCEGPISSYKWSMRTVVISQIMTIVIGTLAISFQRFSLAGHQLHDFGILKDGIEDAETLIVGNPVLNSSSLLKSLLLIWRPVFQLLVISISFLVSFLFLFLDCFLERSIENNEDEEAIEEFNGLIQEADVVVDKWTLREGLNDMGRWIEKAKAPNQLIKLLWKMPPSHEDESPIHQLNAHYDLVRPGYQISSLSVVLLVRIINNVAIPSSLSRSLSRALDEVFEVINFVGRKMSSPSFEKRKKCVLAEALRESDAYNWIHPRILKNFGDEDAFQNQSQLYQTIGIIKGLKEVMRADYVRDEVAMMTDFIQCQAYGSIEELHGYIEQLFVDMVNEFLTQLPTAIFKDIAESNAEEIEHRVKSALRVVCRMEQMEPLIQWSFPVGTTTTHLISDELPDV
ncbi:hypothetical protein Sjap_008330 [Stephania japonica]|uniref:Uncharacterized protein n=1 Tax=Stephania japonica TaxID=461633 RepID=A0AAP0JPA5_9MAGN